MVTPESPISKTPYSSTIDTNTIHLTLVNVYLRYASPQRYHHLQSLNGREGLIPTSNRSHSFVTSNILYFPTARADLHITLQRKPSTFPIVLVQQQNNRQQGKQSRVFTLNRLQFISISITSFSNSFFCFATTYLATPFASHDMVFPHQRSRNISCDNTPSPSVHILLLSPSPTAKNMYAWLLSLPLLDTPTHQYHTTPYERMHNLSPTTPTYTHHLP